MNEILRKIASLLSEYDDGDILLISELIDEITKLKDLVGKNDEKQMGLDHILKLLNGAINGDKSGKVPETISEILDKLEDRDYAKDAAKVVSNTQIDNDGIVGNISEVLKIFVVEADEKIMRAEELILDLEKNLTNKDIINELFRCFHTIKGECGFLKIASFGELAHNIENLLDEIRTGKLEANEEIVEILLEGIDYSKEIITQLKKNDVVVFNKVALDEYVDEINGVFQKKTSNIGELLVRDGKISEADVVKILQKQRESVYTKKFGEVAVEHNFVTEKEVNDTLKIQKTDAASEDLKDHAIKNENNDPIVKVRASKINFLVDMIGELLIAEGMMPENTRGANQIKKITKSIQYAAMQLRTEKVKSLFNNMKRIVRDVSKKLDKEIIFETLGEDLEIDRNLIENLEEPIMHMVRNSAHHGIESVGERTSKGKPAAGKITLGAERRGNSIIISITDDGDGLNKEKIIQKAIEKGIVTQDSVKMMSDNQIYNMIFMQGFSTADKVDLVSGRGVGMDIVKTVITKVRGRIDIKTEKDLFTRFDLVFPLSTAIIDGMIVMIAGENYIIPVANIIESVKPKSDIIVKVKDKIDILHLRDDIIPVINTKQLLNIDKENKYKTDIVVIVENNDKKKFGFTVDEIIAKKEIVIKNLGNKFKNLKGISSGTVLPGGQIGLVLDIEELIDKSQRDGI